MCSFSVVNFTNILRAAFLPRQTVGEIDPWAQFHQCSTRSFCANSLAPVKCKLTWNVSTKKLRAQLTYLKVGEIDPWYLLSSSIVPEEHPRPRRDLADAMRMPGTRWCGRGWTADRVTKFNNYYDNHFIKQDNLTFSNKIQVTLVFGGFIIRI